MAVLCTVEERRESRQKQDEIFKVVKWTNLEVSLTWRLREEFTGLFECKSSNEANTYYESLFASVHESTVKEVIKIA